MSAQAFLDLLPGGEPVTLSGGKIVDAFGVSLSGIGALMRRFPELVDRMLKGDIEAPMIIGVFPEATASVLAAGCGYPGDAQVEAGLARLGLADQAKLLAAVLRRTMPEGRDPFVASLRACAEALGLDVTAFLQQLADAPAA